LSRSLARSVGASESRNSPPDAAKPTRDRVVTSAPRRRSRRPTRRARPLCSPGARASLEFREAHPAPRARSVSNRDRRLRAADFDASRVDRSP
jgi:hypothetical protein